MMIKVIQSLILTSLVIIAQSQNRIDIKNKSFEGFQNNFRLSLKDWIDCGQFYFPMETPPDIHPGGFWGNNKLPSHGKTYLGMVVRDNNSWESIGQQFAECPRVDTCYKFSIDLAKASQYLSKSRLNGMEKNFTTPIVLHIWGSTEPCADQELIASSVEINHHDWRTYHFLIKPKTKMKYFMLEAFYKSQTKKAYCGNIIIDNMSDFEACDCNTILPKNSTVK